MNEDQQFIHIHVDSARDGERQERRDAYENRQRVLVAAARLFAEQGVANVHMTQIADAAGVGKGTLYRRFSNKAELCLALLDNQLESHQESMLDQLRRLHIEGESYLSRVGFFLREVVAFTELHVPLLREVQRESITADDRDAPFFQWQRMTLQGLLRAAANAGEVDLNVDLDVMVDLLLAPLTASYLNYLRQEQHYSTVRIGEALGNLVARLRT